jgi:hypothetical protein
MFFAMASDEPTGELDSRFSTPDATARPWSEVDTVLTDAVMFWISTVRPDGRAHVTPIPAVWTDGALHICTGALEQKAKNLAREQRCVLTTGTNTLDSGLDVVVEGPVRRVTGKPALLRLASLWKERLNWDYEVDEAGFRNEVNDDIVVYALTPLKVLAFGKGSPASQTRFTFAAAAG